VAELTTLAYRPGISLLHTLDARVKMVGLVLISMACLRASLPALTAAALAMCVLAIHCRLNIRALFKEIRFFIVFVAVVWIVRATTTPGDAVWQIGRLAASRQGVFEGALVCGRLMMVVMSGILFIVTTRPFQIKSAVAWFLAPVPLIPHDRVATMMGLIVRFVPVIFGQARQTADAQRARCSENRKNPVYRMSKLAVPVMRRTFITADRLALAMEARCYNESRTPRPAPLGRRDLIALVLIICASLLTAVV